jgi:hypothetical protein
MLALGTRTPSGVQLLLKSQTWYISPPSVTLQVHYPGNASHDGLNPCPILLMSDVIGVPASLSIGETVWRLMQAVRREEGYWKTFLRGPSRPDDRLLPFAHEE